MTDEVLQAEEDLVTATADEADVMKDFNFDDILENPADANVAADDGVVQPMEEIQSGEPTVAPEDIFMSADVAADMSNVSDVSENVTPEVNEQPEVVDFPEQLVDAVPTDNVDADFADEALDNQADLSSLGGLETTNNLAYLKMYDGTLSANMYGIDKNFTEEVFEGTPDCDTIHVNVGYDTYGWNVEFANGTNMGLRDVREYQKRQGCLPFNSGNITYGGKVLRFSDVNRIVVYESVKYFSYGA